MASNERISNQSQGLDFHRDYSEYDELSFCDLPMDHNIDETEELKPQNTSPTLEDDQDRFEFLTSPQIKPASDQAIVFCGEPMGAAKQPGELLRHPRKGRLIRKESFKKCKTDAIVPSKTTSPTSPRGVCVRDSNRSSSFRFGGGPNDHKGVSSRGTGNYRYGRSGNGGSRKLNKVIIGLVKLQPEMELSEIRKRQGRRSPAPMFPATIGADEGEVGGRSHWGILRPLRCRAHFMSALTKASFGCLSHA